MFLDKFTARFKYSFKTDRELLEIILERQALMSQELDALKAAVSKEITVANSLRVLLASIKGNLDAALAKLVNVPVDDKADLLALSASLLQDVDANAAALVANTPAAPVASAPVVAPEPAPVASAPVVAPAPVAADPVSTPAEPAAGSETKAS